MHSSFDPEFEFMKDLTTAKHVDDVNFEGTDEMIDYYQKQVESVFGP